MKLLPYQLANQKMELELKKMQKAKLQQDITQMQLTNEINMLQKHSLELDVFNKENEILQKHSIAMKPASEVLPIQVQTLNIGVLQNQTAQTSQFVYMPSSVATVPMEDPSQSVIRDLIITSGSINSATLLLHIDAGLTELCQGASAEIPVTNNTADIHLEIVKGIIAGEVPEQDVKSLVPPLHQAHAPVHAGEHWNSYGSVCITRNRNLGEDVCWRWRLCRFCPAVKGEATCVLIHKQKS